MIEQTSVIIPCYNCAVYLGEALTSVCSQTRPAREVILIDDGSKVPVQMPSDWNGPPLRLIRTRNRGLPAARNLGISLASGNYVALLDADDVWSSDKLERQETALAARPDAVACFTRVATKPGWLPRTDIEYPDPDLPINEFLVRLWDKYSFVTPSSVMCRREVVCRLGGFDESLRYNEDLEFWFRLLRHGGFIQLTEPLCYYRKHSNQMTKDTYHMTKYRRQAYLKIIAQHGSWLEAAGISLARQMTRVENDYRGNVLQAYFYREMGIARRLLWSYLLERPWDLQIQKYAMLSLLPSWLLIRLRGQLSRG